MKLIIVIILSVIVLTSVSSCTQEMRESFGEMFELSGKLGERFGEGSPNVSIGDKGISATFINASFNDLPLEEKKAKAREIAVFIKDNYSKIERIENITVAFGVHRDFGFFQYNSNMDAHQFKVAELNSAVNAAAK